MNFDDMLGALDARHGVNGEGEGHFCDCAELIVCGVRVPVPPGHDCEYVRERTMRRKIQPAVVGSGFSGSVLLNSFITLPSFVFRQLHVGIPCS